MKRKARKMAFLWAGGTIFVALLSASWIASRSLALPAPSASFIREHRPTFEGLTEPGNFLDVSTGPSGVTRSDSTYARYRQFKVAGDFPSILKRIQQEVGSTGENKGRGDFHFWVWASSKTVTKRGWSMAVLYAGNVTTLDHGERIVFIRLNSWRPKTILDPVLEWLRKRS